MINNHPDGLGFMRRENGRVIVETTVGNAIEKFEMFRKWRFLKSYAMHSRFATHGKVSVENCHPFKILSIDDGDQIDMYMMHNGSISGYPDVEKDMSDTYNFAKYLLRPLAQANPDLIWENEHWQAVIQAIIGNHSKLLFMRSDDHKYPILIFNRKAGVNKNNCWLSNGFSTDSFYRKKENHTNIVHTWEDNSYNPLEQKNSTSGKTNTDTDSSTKEDLFDWENYMLTRYGSHEEIMARCSNTGIPDPEGFWYKDDKGEIRYAGPKPKQGKLFLPREEGKVIELVRKVDNNGAVVYQEKKENSSFVIHGETYTVDEANHLHEMLTTLRGMDDASVKQVMLDDPDMICRLIILFYEKNTMPYNTIWNQIYEGTDAIILLIKNLSTEKGLITRLLKQA